MAAADRQVVTVEELRGLLEQDQKARPGLDEDRLVEYAVAALSTLRGLSRNDKMKVVRRMTKMLGVTRSVRKGAS